MPTVKEVVSVLKNLGVKVNIWTENENADDPVHDVDIWGESKFTENRKEND